MTRVYSHSSRTFPVFRIILYGAKSLKCGITQVRIYSSAELQQCEIPSREKINKEIRASGH
jgi:hypothetical protein